MAKKSKVNIVDIRTLFEQGLSTYKIAEKLGCNQSHVCRMIKKWNVENPENAIKVRSKSEAQKLHIATEGHQRQGVTHSEASKTLISDSMRTFYESSEGDEAKAKIKQHRAEEWAALSPEQKNDIIVKLRVANREQQKLGKGSKFENFLIDELSKLGFAVEQRTHAYTPGQKMEVDIALPVEGIAIEVDGPTHWDETVYGPEALAVVKEKDNIKNELLNSVGFNILRLQDKTGACTRARVQRIFEAIKDLATKKASGAPVGVYVIRL